MPTYEQDPKELLGEDIQQIATPDDSDFIWKRLLYFLP
jgi:hypothetical protein